ncbi:MAG: FKBP-type peptidyl-prolyl cis-trans isomerase [Pirellulales bacterium]|nr:FKBP-type peptidyl-prolyl cis-trans isomerase [Pirellulales bacterium]
MRCSSSLCLMFAMLAMLALVSDGNCQPAPPEGAAPAKQSPSRPSGVAGQTEGTAPAGANDAMFRSQVSYALGRNFAMNLKEGQVDVDLQAIMAGMSDTLSGAQPKWTDEQLGAVMQRFAREMQQRQMAQMQQAAKKNQAEEAAFLAQNGTREGVQSTPSGLQYRVLQEGKGPSPTLKDRVKCNYTGTLLNGTVFDASARHGGPAEFAVGEVIPGWTEALQKMRAGDKWQLFVPAKLAYGMEPPGAPIEPGSMLVFEIELLEVLQ